MSQESDAAFAALSAQVKANTDAEAAAIIVMNGFASRVDAAVAKAMRQAWCRDERVARYRAESESDLQPALF